MGAPLVFGVHVGRGPVARAVAPRVAGRRRRAPPALLALRAAPSRRAASGGSPPGGPSASARAGGAPVTAPRVRGARGGARPAVVRRICSSGRRRGRGRSGSSPARCGTPSSRSSATSGSRARSRTCAASRAATSTSRSRTRRRVIGAVLWGSQARAAQVRARGGAGGHRPRVRRDVPAAREVPAGRPGGRAARRRRDGAAAAADEGAAAGGGLLDPARKRRAAVHPAPRRRRDEPERGGAPRLPARAARPVPSLPVLVAPCRVQGEGAAATVVSAVRALCRAPVDVIVVTRGGGSRRTSAPSTTSGSPAPSPRVPSRCSAVGHRGRRHGRGPGRGRARRHADPRRAARRAGQGRARRVAAFARRARRARRALGARGAAARGARAPRRDPRPAAPPLARAAPPRRPRPTAPRPPSAPGRAPRASGSTGCAPAWGGRSRAGASARSCSGWRPRRAGLAPGRRPTSGARGCSLERLGARLEPANVAKLLSRGFSLVLRDGKHLVTRSSRAAPDDAVRIALAEGWLDARVTSRDHGDDPLPGRPGSAGGTVVRPPAGRALTPSGGAVNGCLEERVSDADERGAPAATNGETYDAIVVRLERVVGELESGQLSLEQSIEKFAEGVRLARDASRKLDDAERRVELLVRSVDGERRGGAVRARERPGRAADVRWPRRTSHEEAQGHHRRRRSRHARDADARARARGLRRRAAANGLRLISAMHVDRPDVILLDVMMSWIDGFELCRAIKKNPTFGDIPVIFISARKSPEDDAPGSRRARSTTSRSRSTWTASSRASGNPRSARGRSPGRRPRRGADEAPSSGAGA